MNEANMNRENELMPVDMLMVDVFDKAMADSGSNRKESVIRHVQNRLIEIYDDFPKNMASDMLLRRYFDRWVSEKDPEEISGFSNPNDTHKEFFSVYLGYKNYNAYLAHIHRGQYQRIVNQSGDGTNVYIEKHIGDNNFN